MHRIRRVIAAAAVGALGSTLLVLAAPAAGAGGKAPTWKVGDCYATADVDADNVELTSKVDCSREHAVQIVAGRALPKDLAGAGLDPLLDRSTPQRTELLTLVRDTCTPAATAKSLYPTKTAKRLASLFAKHDVTEWMAPAAGMMGWVLPDADAFAAGATDLLCVYIPNPDLTGSSAGDLRDIGTSAPLPTLRLCADFDANGVSSQGVPCDGDHDIESLIWVSLDASGLPVDPRTWSEEEWAPLDRICTEFATAVIGARRSDIVVNADTDPAQAPVGGTRFFNCRAFPEVETDAFPAGVILTGRGAQKIAYTDT